MRELALEGGPPLCVSEGYPYPIEPVQLARDDMLVVTTDGVTEARAPDGGLFGRTRCVTVLEERAADITPQTAVDTIVEAVRKFEDGDQPTDDLTVMAVLFKGRCPSSR